MLSIFSYVTEDRCYVLSVCLCMATISSIFIISIVIFYCLSTVNYFKILSYYSVSIMQKMMVKMDGVLKKVEEQLSLVVSHMVVHIYVSINMTVCMLVGMWELMGNVQRKGQARVVNFDGCTLRLAAVYIVILLTN